MTGKRQIDVALIGWPRCGTSSLFEWMDAHPYIVGTRPKETNFFFDAHHPLCGRHGRSLWADGEEAYADFFPQNQKGLHLDGSVYTFCQQTAMEIFGCWNGPPLVAATLRQPAERILSSFRYTQGNLGSIDRNLDFNEYVEALLAGDMDRITPNYVSKSSLWIATRELELTRYVEWLEQWQSIVGEEHLIILVSEELQSHPKIALKDVCAKLGLDSSFYDHYSFDRRNPSLSPRSQRVHRWAQKVGSHLPSSQAKSRLKNAYYRVQIDPLGHEHVTGDKEGLRKLDEYFEPWNEQLAQRFGLDLGHWLVER
jgi:hypothetical protein